VVVSFGEPINVPREATAADLELMKEHVAEAMNTLTREVDALVARS
jgi:hypothetical protein